MCSNDLLKHVALRDEEIGASCYLEQRIGPFSITGIGNDFSIHLDPVGEAGSRFVVMADVEWGDTEASNLITTADLDRPQVQFKRQFALAGKCCGE